MDFISCLMLRDLHPLILQGGLTITQTQRPVEIGAPDGNRTHISRIESGCSIAVELRDCPRSGCNYCTHLADAVLRRAQRNCTGRQITTGKWRDRTEALHAGDRTRTAKAFATDGTPSLWRRITDQLRPIVIGQEVGICTRTVSFTGRDAAITPRS